MVKKRAIIHKWRKLGTVVNLLRSGRPTKITPREQHRLIQEVIKEPRTTSKELQASLASIKVSVNDSTIRKRLGKNGIHGRVPRQKPLLTKNNTKARLTFVQKYLDFPQDFWANILWTDATKVDIFGRFVSRYIWHKPTHFIKRTSYNSQTWWWWCDGLGLLCSFRTWMTCHNWWNHDFCTLSENPEGEWPGRQIVTSSSSALGSCSRTMIPNTPASPPLNWDAVAWP